MRTNRKEQMYADSEYFHLDIRVCEFDAIPSAMLIGGGLFALRRRDLG